MRRELNRFNNRIILTIAFVFILLCSGVILLQRHLHVDLPLTTMPINVYDNDIILGADRAPLTIIMFHSYYNAKGRLFFNETFPLLKEEYINSGKAKFIIKHIEPSEHPDMMLALQTAICLNQHGKWQKFHDILVFNPVSVHTEEFKQLIDEYIAVNSNLAECILSKQKFDDVARNNNDYYMLNSKGSPTFVINNKLLKKFEGTEEFFGHLNKELDNF